MYELPFEHVCNIVLFFLIISFHSNFANGCLSAMLPAGVTCKRLVYVKIATFDINTPERY